MKRMWSEEEIQALIEEQGGSGEKIYKHDINISNKYYFTLYLSDNLPLTFTTLGMNHAGYYALTYPSCFNLASDLRIETSIKIISAATIEVYGFKVIKSDLATTAQLLSTLSTSGNTITDTVTEV